MFALAEDEVMSRTRGLEAELAEARSKIKQLESRIETDALLDIFNRRGFERELARALLQVNRYQRSAAVVFIDLDNFKSINDRFGHLAGDATLKAVAETIIKACRASDTVARFGGDEFAVLLWTLRECDARAKAQSLEEKIEAMKMCFATERQLGRCFRRVHHAPAPRQPDRSDSPCRQGHVFPKNGEKDRGAAFAGRLGR